jgi:hypothetical protein
MGHWLLVTLLGCAATTSRPYFQPVPTAAVAEIELGIPQATRALAEGLAKDSIALSIIKENDGFIDSGWLDAGTLEHTGARPLGAGVVRIRAWVNPAKQFWSELSVEATFRPMDDPSRPERELDVPLPEDHPLQKRLGAVIEKLIVQYGDADALRDFQQKTATAKADTLKVKPDTGKADTTKVKPDTAKAKPDTSRKNPSQVGSFSGLSHRPSHWLPSGFPTPRRSRSEPVPSMTVVRSAPIAKALTPSIPDIEAIGTPRWDAP